MFNAETIKKVISAFEGMVEVLKAIERNTRLKSFRNTQVTISENTILEIANVQQISFQNQTSSYVRINNRLIAPFNIANNEVPDGVTYIGLYPYSKINKDNYQIRFVSPIAPGEYLLVEYQQFITED